MKYESLLQRKIHPAIAVALLVTALAAAVRLEYVTRPQPYECWTESYTLTVTDKELKRDSLLVFGVTEDGREIAVGRHTLVWCEAWTTKR